MLGIWKNYDELESSLSMPELLSILKGIRDNEKRQQRFLAAIQGIDLDKEEDSVESQNKEVSTLEQVQARAVARITGDKNLAGAIESGISPDWGVEYVIAEGTEIG